MISKIQVILVILFVAGLFYIILPEPKSIEDFPKIPNSYRFEERNVEIPDYYSNFDRNQITEHYRSAYRNHFLFGMFLPPISLNHPPNMASDYIQKYQIGTFLEEYVYPFHGSLFVNGYEPYIEREILNLPHNPAGDYEVINGRFYDSITTIRYYPNSWYARLLVYVGIWLAFFGVYKIGKRAIKE